MDIGRVNKAGKDVGGFFNALNIIEKAEKKSRKVGAKKKKYLTKYYKTKNKKTIYATTTTNKPTIKPTIISKSISDNKKWVCRHWSDGGVTINRNYKKKK